METITIELRSRLRSCNIFISTRDTLDNNLIKLKLNESVITLQIGNQTKHLPLKLFKIIPKTLSSLTVKKNWILFRVQTQPNELVYGSFQTEVVGRTNSPDRLKVESNDIELRLKEKKCVLHCSYCSNDISKVLFFKRVLPLPTSNYEPSEWFCCSHDENNFSTLLSPSEMDCFFEKNYKLLNREIFKKELKIDDDRQTVTCDRCLSRLGACSISKECLKIWNCCVEYRFLDNSSSIIKASDPLKDFALIIDDRMDVFTNNQLLMEAADDSQSHYLLVQIMNRNLELLVEKDNANSHVTDTIELVYRKVTKLLYKYSETETELKSYCINVERCQIALPVMLAAIDHLSSTTKRYPLSYRIIDKFFVGYIYF